MRRRAPSADLVRSASCGLLAGVLVGLLDAGAALLGGRVGGPGALGVVVVATALVGVVGAAVAAVLTRLLRRLLGPAAGSARGRRWGLPLLVVVVVAHGVNAWAYVRLYAEAHRLLTWGTLALAVVAVWLVMPPPRGDAPAARRTGALAGLISVCALLVWAAHLVLSARPDVRVAVQLESTVARQAARFWSRPFDADGDGWSHFGGADCDDGDAAVHPGAPETAGDGVDSDCLGGDARPGPDPSARGGDGAAEPLPRGVVLVTIESLRADRVDPTRLAAMPNLASLASRGTLYRRAYATASWTAPSVYSLLTGRYPSRIRWTRAALEDAVRWRPLAAGEGPWLRNTYVLPTTDRSRTLAQCAGEAGLRTAAVATTPFMLPEAGLLRGFSEVARDVYLRMNLRLSGKVDGPAVVTGLQWLDGLGPAERFLLWLHLPDPHHPYLGTGATAAERYAEELQGTDAALGALWQGLQARGLAGQVVLAITGDHGEELGEHGGAYHGASLYEEVVRVPLVLAAPGLPAGAVVDTPVSLTDLPVTLAALAGLSCPVLRRVADGIDLRAAARAPRAVFAERVRDGWSTAVVDGGAKAIADHAAATLRAWDLAADPLEQRPAASAPAALVRLLTTHAVGRQRAP